MSAHDADHVVPEWERDLLVASASAEHEARYPTVEEEPEVDEEPVDPWADAPKELEQLG